MKGVSQNTAVQCTPVNRKFRAEVSSLP